MKRQAWTTCWKRASPDRTSCSGSRLAHPHVHTVIVGTTRLEHLRENVGTALKGPLPSDVYAEAKRRLDAVGERAAPVE